MEFLILWCELTEFVRDAYSIAISGRVDLVYNTSELKYVRPFVKMFIRRRDIFSYLSTSMVLLSELSSF